jgi:hypothetical protein
MKNVGSKLFVFGAVALFALAPAPASADSGRHRTRDQWHDHKPHQAKDHRRDRKRPRIDLGARHYRYFGDDPDRYFGVGPGSYECYGYDCNW